MTLSVTARCARTGMFGVAVTSSSPAVAARCAFARAKAGAVSTQNITDPRLGPAGLDLLASGHDAVASLDALKSAAGPHLPYRQLAVIDGAGRAAAHTGDKALGIAGHRIGRDVVAAGNLLASLTVLDRMIEAFERESDRHLAERLLAAIDAGMEAGGEAGPVHSAGLLVVDAVSWPLVDLRVDWSSRPLHRLRDLWELWQPQMDAYITRGLNPAGAPSYGVLGDL